MAPGAGTEVTNSRPANPDSDAALARYAARLRPMRIGYAIVLLVLALIAAAIVVVEYQHGEISHATLKTVPTAPPAVALGTPSATLKLAWTSTDTAAIGIPYYKGTIVTHDTHTVRGRNALTGAQTWSYTRTDRSVCAAVDSGATTIAVFELHGSCDELTALDSSTGQRQWTRTLDENGAVFDGTPSYFVLGTNAVFVSKTSIYSINVSGFNAGVDNWSFHHTGCTINSVVFGAAGALISQTCVHEDCDDAKFCGNGTQLLLRDPSANFDDNSKTNMNNPDKIIWNSFGNDLIPTLAGDQVAARESAGGILHFFNATTGKAGVRLTLAGDSGRSAPVAAAATNDTDLLWLGNRTYALPQFATAFSWQAATRTVPTVVGAQGGTMPALADSILTVPTPTGIAQLDPATGKTKQEFTVTAPPAGSLVYPFGTGFVVAGSSTTVYQSERA